MCKKRGSGVTKTMPMLRGADVGSFCRTVSIVEAVMEDWLCFDLDAAFDR
jgi:hypothetical protein